MNRSMRRRGGFAMVPLACATLATTAGVGLAEGLLTDRPDFTETSTVIRAGGFQLEGGITRAQEQSDWELAGPELLMRLGLWKRVELRLGAPDAVVSDARTTPLDLDIGEAYLGFKVQLGPDGAPWGAALIPAATFPMGDEEELRGIPELVATWATDLPRNMSLGGIVGYAWLEQADAGEDVLFPTVSLGVPFGENVGAFFEWAAEFSDGVDSAHLFHQGFTFAISPRFQLDLHYGVGLTEPAPDFFLGGGFALGR
jgi:hypothetical protein